MRRLNKFIGDTPKLEFGDYILFQEYEQDKHDGKQYHYKISKPILAIYLGCFVADQTIGFNYVRWINEQHHEVNEIEQHIEWNDYIDILGHWKCKPNWKGIIESYRKQNPKQSTSASDIEWGKI